MNNPQGENNLGDEFRSLGKNISAIFRAAWESQERQDVQKEIGEGLKEIVSSLNKAADEFKESNTGQQFTQDIADLNSRFRNGEVQGKIRNEIIEVLNKINRELENTTHHWKPTPDPDPASNPVPESPGEADK